jgi:hypothetical protein
MAGVNIPRMNAARAIQPALCDTFEGGGLTGGMAGKLVGAGAT